ncbi:MAG: hypothetical protein ACREXS_04195 [Gammaproteobacteria bacterium]
MQPRLRAGTEFNDNKRLTLLAHDSVFGSSFEFGGALIYASEVNAVKLTPRTRILRYTEDSGVDLDSEDVFVDGLAEHTGERLGWELRSNFTRDTTLVSELETTGITQVRKIHQSYELSPSVSYLATEYNTIRLGGTYNDVVYEDAENAGLLDYDYASVSLSDSYTITDRSQLTATVFYSRFEPVGNRSKTESIGGQAGYQWVWSDALQGSVALGYVSNDVQQTEIELQAVQTPFGPFFFPIEVERNTTEGGLLVDATIEKTLENSLLTGSFRRAVIPTGNGRQNNRDEVRFSARHDFTDRTQANVGFVYTNSSDQSQGNEENSRDYFRIEAAWRYRLSERLSLSVSYAHARLASTIGDEVALSNAFFVTLGFDGDKWTLSR